MWFRGFALQILKKLNFNRVPWLTRSRHMILGVWYLKIRKNIENMLWNHGYYDSWLVSIILSRVRLRVKIMVARSNVCRQKVWIVTWNAKTSRVYPELKKTVAKRDRSIKNKKKIPRGKGTSLPSAPAPAASALQALARILGPLGLNCAPLWKISHYTPALRPVLGPK